jgi:hypothetical protein
MTLNTLITLVLMPTLYSLFEGGRATPAGQGDHEGRSHRAQSGAIEEIT